MKNFLRKSGLIVVLLALMSAMSSYALGPLTGRVINSVTSAPVEGALVQIGSSYITTGIDGIFTFTDVASGTKTVTITKQWYHRTNHLKSITGASQNLGDLALTFNHFGFEGGNGGYPLWQQFTNVANFNGAPMVNGDEIAVFDGVKCVGVLIIDDFLNTYNVWDQKNNLICYSILAQNWTPSSPPDGYTPGASSSYKAWSHTQGFSTSAVVARSNPDGGGYMSNNFPPTYSYGLSAFTFGNTATFSVSGNVKNIVTNSNIELANITIDGFGGLTNSLGNWFTTLPAATYTLTVSKPGYSTQAIPVTVTGTTVQNVFLVPNPGTISGRVINADLVGLDGVTISAGAFSISTSGGGYYSLANVTPGTYTVTATKAGYISSSLPGIVVIVGGTTSGVNFTLGVTPHFPVVTPGDPDYTWTIYLAGASFEGNQLQAGDEIALFDVVGSTQTICAKYTLTEPLTVTPTTNHRMIAWEKGPFFTGYTPGHNYVFKCWDVSAAKEGTGATVTFAEPSSYSHTVFPTSNSDEYSTVNISFAVINGIQLFGYVKDPSGGKLLGVTVTAVGPAVYTTTTIPEGADLAEFHFNNIIPGNYALTFNFPGYEPPSAPVNATVLSNQVTYIGFVTMSPTVVTQSIPLRNGVNWVSSYVVHNTPLISDIIPADFRIGANGYGGLNTGSPLRSVKNAGSVIYLCMPEAGTPTTYPFGPLPTPLWANKEGYVFTMNQAAMLSIMGTRVNATTEIALENNTASPKTFFIGYLPGTEFSATAALSQLIVGGTLTSTVEFIKNQDALYLRNLGPTLVNDIGNMKPGQGYQIKVAANSTVNFVYQTAKSAETTFDGTATHFQVNGDAAGNVFTIYVKGGDFEAGDEIAVYDGDKLVGARKLGVGTGDYDNPVPAFHSLSNGEGYRIGNQFSLRAWDASQNKEVPVYYTLVNNGFSYNNVIFPKEDGMFCIANLSKYAIGINEKIAPVINIYPNPASDRVNVIADREISRITLINRVGLIIREIPVMANQITLNVEGLSSGLYMIKIETAGMVTTRKVVIK